MRTSESAEKRALAWISGQGGIFRSREAIASGVYARTLTQMEKEGKLEKISRGIYRLADSPPISNPDLVTVAMAVPNAVICLISALAFHRLTTQIPRKVYVALRGFSRTPAMIYPPLAVHRLHGEAFEKGIEEHMIDGVKVRIYDPEKTLADCFKFRNKIGLDVALEGLKLYRSRKKFNMKALVKYARICRVEKQMMPYIEALA